VAFRRSLDQIVATLPADDAVRQAVARAAIGAMVEAPHDNHALNEVGVAPDHYAPLTAADLSNGHDPGLAKAIELL
jgi:hypothetical protein